MTQNFKRNVLELEETRHLTWGHGQGLNSKHMENIDSLSCAMDKWQNLNLKVHGPILISQNEIFIQMICTIDHLRNLGFKFQLIGQTVLIHEEIMYCNCNCNCKTKQNKIPLEYIKYGYHYFTI